MSFSKICFLCRFFGKSCQIASGKKYFGGFDRLVFLLPFLALVSAVFSPLEKSFVVKGALVLTSLVVLYWIFRNFLEDEEARRRVPFFILLGSIPVLVSGLWQAFFIRSKDNRFVVMPERINATFTEPDWLGVYLVVFLAFLLWLRRYFLEKKINLRVGGFSAGKIIQAILWFWLGLVFLKHFSLSPEAAGLAWERFWVFTFSFGLGIFIKKSGNWLSW